MSNLIPVIYRNMNYPSHIKANIHEISGNFYKKKLIVKSPYSLHTECSHGERIFNSKIDNDFVHIRSAHKNNVPKLWYNKEWAEEFYEYLKWFIGNNPPPEVLEIHPPFNDYCGSLNEFIEIFDVFYQNFIRKYPNTIILLENRFGTRYKGGKFILSTCIDVWLFCKLISDKNIKLKIALDYPQIFSAEINRGKTAKRKFEADSHEIFENIISLNFKLKEYSNVIGGIHMWGKLKSKDGKRLTPHAGNLDDFFNKNKLVKEAFLNSVFTVFNDGIARYFVPEVHSGENDLHSIVYDMEQTGFKFISNN